MNKKLLIGIIVVFLMTVAIGVYLFVMSAKTQKVYHVGILSGVDFFASSADGFKAKMTELGYVEGKNIVYDLQKLNADSAGEQRVAKKFVEDKVDLIFVFPTEASLAVKTATEGTGIPVVFANAFLEGNNLVESVQHPGGYITGVRYPGSDLTVKHLEIFHELIPQAKRFYLIYNPDYPTIPPTLSVLRQAASAMNITLVESQVSSVEDIQTELETRAKLNDIGIDVILSMPDLLTNSPEASAVIAKFAVEHKIPVDGPAVTVTAENPATVFGYDPDSIEVGSLAATLADKIFKGIPAGTIPVVTPEVHLRLNYKVAQDLGLNVSEGLLAKADEIIR